MDIGTALGTQLADDLLVPDLVVIDLSAKSIILRSFIASHLDLITRADESPDLGRRNDGWWLGSAISHLGDDRRVSMRQLFRGTSYRILTIDLSFEYLISRLIVAAFTRLQVQDENVLVLVSCAMDLTQTVFGTLLKADLTNHRFPGVLNQVILVDPQLVKIGQDRLNLCLSKSDIRLMLEAIPRRTIINSVQKLAVAPEVFEPVSAHPLTASLNAIPVTAPMRAIPTRRTSPWDGRSPDGNSTDR